jgi:predicted nicotinamide N-methyase
LSSLDLVEETVALRARTLSILRPRSAEALLDEEAFEHEEFLPYWAELWASGEALARAVAERDVEGLHVVELGCGLALPSLAAALGGARVLATDWSPDAVALARENASRNELDVETAVVRWSEPEPLVAGAPWDLVLAADVLYERRNVDELLALLPKLGKEVLLAEPGRPHAKTFFELAAATWTIEPRGQVVHG